MPLSLDKLHDDLVQGCHRDSEHFRSSEDCPLDNHLDLRQGKVSCTILVILQKFIEEGIGDELHIDGICSLSTVEECLGDNSYQSGDRLFPGHCIDPWKPGCIRSHLQEGCLSRVVVCYLITHLPVLPCFRMLVHAGWCRTSDPLP